MIPSNVHAVWWGDKGLEKREEEARDDSEAEYLYKSTPIWQYKYTTYAFQMNWYFPMLLLRI